MGDEKRSTEFFRIIDLTTQHADFAEPLLAACSHYANDHDATQIWRFLRGSRICTRTCTPRQSLMSKELDKPFWNTLNSRHRALVCTHPDYLGRG